MNEIEKSAIRLKHWIDHNVDHLTGYREVVEILDSADLSNVAKKIREGIRLIEEANKAFQDAMRELPAPGAHTHDHGHDHTHDLGHDHGHGHKH